MTTSFLKSRAGGPAGHARKHPRLTATLKAPLAVPFIGRRHELDALTRVLDASPILIQGVTGIGKSRLVEEFSALARDQGVEPVVGRCYPFAEVGPYAPVLQALQKVAGDNGALDKRLAQLEAEFGHADSD